MSTAAVAAILDTVRRIPAGRVASYGLIADLAGFPGRARLVGHALRKDTGDTPWHRVVRSSGQLAFAQGSAQATRQIALLAHEKVVVQAHRVRLAQYAWDALPDLLFADYMAAPSARGTKSKIG